MAFNEEFHQSARYIPLAVKAIKQFVLSVKHQLFSLNTKLSNYFCKTVKFINDSLRLKCHFVGILLVSSEIVRKIPYDHIKFPLKWWIMPDI